MGKLHRCVASREVAADPATVWDVISDHSRMTEWAPARRVVVESSGSPDKNGVGAVRALYAVGPPIRERVTGFDPPTELRYELVSGLPYRDYEGRLVVEPSGSGSRLTCTITFRTIVPGSHIAIAMACRRMTRSASKVAERRASSR